MNLKPKTNVVFLLLIAMLSCGLLFISCGQVEEEETTGGNAVAQPQLTIANSARSFTLEKWTSASPDEKTFTVKLSDNASGSYQWSSSTDRKVWAEIAGATGNTFMPADIAAAGIYNYSVTVKTGPHTLVGAASIRITDASTTPAETKFTIGSNRMNYIRGVGGTGAFMFREGTNADASPDVDVKYIDLLMGEIGCNILRIMVQDDYENYINNDVQSKNKSVFFHDAQKNFFAVIRRANELNGYVFANPWTAPPEFKANNSVYAGQIRTTASNYIGYANWLRGFMEWLNDNNAPIFALGILNEPDWGGSSNYEGMGMSQTNHRDWFKTAGHFTTQVVTNPSGATIGNAEYTDDIIPGYGGGGPTHHVLAMTGDNMGDHTWYNSTIDDAAANKNFEILGRHGYQGGYLRASKIAGANNTAWANRPSGYTGHKEVEALTASPQMFAPGSTAGNIKREVWQTEHDFNYWSNSTNIHGSNVHRGWNSAFAAMNDLDWSLRVVGESVFDWWFSQSWSGLVTSYQGAPVDGNGEHDIKSDGATPWRAYEYTPRGRAFAHYARYVNETWLLDITGTGGESSKFNQTNNSFNAGATDPKISAFEDVNGKFISIVMFTPNASTSTDSIATASSSGVIPAPFGNGGTNPTDDPTRLSVNVGRIEVVLPSGFTATSATALRSYGWQNADDKDWDDVPKGTPRYWITEPVFLNTSDDGTQSVEVTLKGGNIISIMVKGTWPGRVVASPERKRPYTVE